MKYSTLLKRYTQCVKQAASANNGTQDKAWYIKQAEVYRLKLSDMDKAIGRFHRPVGNYKTKM